MHHTCVKMVATPVMKDTGSTRWIFEPERHCSEAVARTATNSAECCIGAESANADAKNYLTQPRFVVELVHLGHAEKEHHFREHVHALSSHVDLNSNAADQMRKNTRRVLLLS